MYTQCSIALEVLFIEETSDRFRFRAQCVSPPQPHLALSCTTAGGLRCLSLTIAGDSLLSLLPFLDTASIHTGVAVAIIASTAGLAPTKTVIVSFTTDW